MKNMRNSLSWGFALVIWFFGALLLWKTWKFQKTVPDPLGSYIEFTVMFVATFYILILIPLKYYSDKIFCHGQSASPAFARP